MNISSIRERKDMLKKVKYIFDEKQKIKLIIMTIVILVGAFVELLGVSTILPLVNVVLEPSKIDSTWYLLWIKEHMHYTKESEVIVFMAVVLIVVYIAKNLYVTMMYDMQYRFIFNNQRRLSVKMLDVYMRQNYLFHVQKNVAELQRNIKEDVNGFYTIVLNALQLLAEVSVCIVLAIFLLSTDVQSTLIVAALIFVFSLLVGVVSKKVLVKKGIVNREMNIQLNKWLLQSLSGIKEIKVMNKEAFFLNKYSKTFNVYSTIQRQQSMLTFIPRPLMEVICVCSLLVTLIIKMLTQEDGIETFIPTLAVFAVAAFRMLPSFNRVSGYISTIMFNKPSVDVLYHDLKEIEKITKDNESAIAKDSYHALPLIKGITLEHVSFQYPEVDRWVLKDVSMKIEPNQSVALIGASGAGKTTLADIILGILEPQEGKILADDKDIKDYLSAWHNSIGYIPQSIYLFDDTIKANIAFGISEDEIDEKELQRAMKEAQLDAFVQSLPEKENTIVGDRGVKLSGGQRQRIGIARALYRNPNILILDEATSALDNETEKEVMDAIDGLHGKRTIIIIAHRLSTIKKCDQIFEVGNGAVKTKKYEEVFEE